VMYVFNLREQTSLNEVEGVPVSTPSSPLRPAARLPRMPDRQLELSVTRTMKDCNQRRKKQRKERTRTAIIILAGV